jgi:hypothetical protein
MPDDDLRSQLVDLIDGAAAPVTFDEVRARPAPNRRARGRVTAAIAVAALILATLGAAIAITRDRHTPTTVVTQPLPTTTPTTQPTAVDVGQLPKLPASAIGTFHLPPDLQVSDAVAAFGSLWLTGYRSSCAAACPSLFRLDVGVDTVEGIPGPTLEGLGLASGDGSLFVLSDRPDGSPYQVTRIDVPSYRVRYTVDVPDTHVFGNTNPIGRIAVGFDSVWVYEGNDYVARLDARTGAQTARIALPPNQASNGLAVNEHGVWSVAFGNTDVTRIDPGTNTAVVATNFAPGFAQSIAADASWVWITHSTKTVDLARIDASDPARVDSTHIQTADVASGDGGVWFLGWVPADEAGVPVLHAGLIGPVDPQTLAVTATAELPIGAADETKLAVGDGAAWVVDSSMHTAWRIQAPDG